MKQLYAAILCLASFALCAQSVKGKITMRQAVHERDFIVRNTQVILLTKTSRDTVAVNDNLEFEFPQAVAGTAFLYLSSPVLPEQTQYKFRIRKSKPTRVTLLYDQFQSELLEPIKTAEDREEEIEIGLVIARLAADMLIFFNAR